MVMVEAPRAPLAGQRIVDHHLQFGEIDAAMRAELAVLRHDDRMGEHRRDVVQRHPAPVVALETSTRSFSISVETGCTKDGR